MIIKLLSDKKFLLKIMTLDKAKEVKKAFEEQKVDLSIEECEALRNIIKIIAKKKRPLNLEELESISGGINKFLKRIEEALIGSPLISDTIIGALELLKFTKHEGVNR